MHQHAHFAGAGGRPSVKEYPTAKLPIEFFGAGAGFPRFSLAVFISAAAHAVAVKPIEGQANRHVGQGKTLGRDIEIIAIDDPVFVIGHKLPHEEVLFLGRPFFPITVKFDIVEVEDRYTVKQRQPDGQRRLAGAAISDDLEFHPIRIFDRLIYRYILRICSPSLRPVSANP